MMRSRDSRLRFEVFRYGDLGSAQASSRYGLTVDQIASLRAHPYAQPADPAGLLLLEGDRPCGRFGLIPGRLRAAGTEYPTYWSSDWQVEHPGPSAGALLLAVMREAGRLCVGGPSASSAPVFRAAGFSFLPLIRMVRPLRGRAIVRRHLAGAVARVVTLPIDGYLGIRRRQLRSRDPASGILEFRSRFDPEISDVDRAVNETCCFPRDDVEFNWAIDHPWIREPGYRYGVFYLRSGLGELLAYALTRTRDVAGRRVGSVMRISARPPAEIAAASLLLGTVDSFFRAGVDVAELHSSKPAILDAARRAGFSERGRISIAAKFDRTVDTELRARGLDLRAFAADMGEGDMIFA